MSAFVTLNGIPVVEARVCIPRVGVWYADCVLDAGSLPTRGGVELLVGDGALALYGTIRRGGISDGRAQVRVVAGAGGLADPAVPKHYRNVPLRIPATDLLTDAGERLSPASDAGSLGANLSHWVSFANPASVCLSALCETAPGLVWRVLPDGRTWLGREAWPASRVGFKVLTNHPERDRVTVTLDAPVLLPGRTLGGRRVAHVQHVITAEKAQAEVLFER